MPFPQELTRLLGVEHPVIQAPMAGATTPELVAAVSEAGGLGSFGAAFMSPAAIGEAGRAIRALTDKPFALNLLLMSTRAPALDRLTAMIEALRPYHQELGLGVPALPERLAESFEAQVEAVLAARPAAFSFAFGIPAPHVLEAFRERGVRLLGTATTVAEARALEAAGVDAVVAQGTEAGGHRGTFLGSFEDAMVGTLALVPQVVDAVRLPVVAAGGIADGRAMAAALALGAGGVQVGTAFLARDEAGVPAAYRRALAGATDDGTIVTRAFSGRPARGLRNRFATDAELWLAEPLAFPAQNALTRAMRLEASRQDQPELLSLWAGQAAALARPGRAADLVRDVVEQARQVMSRLGA